MKPRPGFAAGLLALYGLIWIALALQPADRSDWLLENLLVLLALAWLLRRHYTDRFSDFSYACLFVLLVLHAIGAHYTYSEVPYERWSEALLGTSINDLLGWQRNHFDRLVHFGYGLLVTPAACELLDRRAPTRGLWRYLLPLLLISAHATFYETVEWLAAELFGGDLGQAFLGTQGDVFDAQKDSALAVLGALLGVLVVRRGGRHSEPASH